MHDNFLKLYLDALDKIPGWLYPDAALLFMAYNQLIAAEGIAGDVLEIGIYHGKSAIGVAALRGEGRTFVAVDLFDDMQSFTVSSAGSGMQAAFIDNMRAFYGEIPFVRTLTCSSTDLRPSDLGNEFSFCHIDGGHLADQVYHDLDLCHHILLPGGLVALDDYFNPKFPGVAEGAITFMLEHREAFTPIAIGYNKVMLQKCPAPFDLNARFAITFSFIPKNITRLWQQPVHLLEFGVFPFIDVARSTPHHLVPSSELTIRAVIDPQVSRIEAERSQPANLPVRVVNESSIVFQWGIGLSYHLFGSDGSLLRWDNGRSIFTPPLHPDEERIINLGVVAPNVTGTYQLEIDLVWEGVTWFKDRGNATRVIDLSVT